MILLKHSLIRVAMGATVASAALLLLIAPARAHTELISTDPQAGARLSAPPKEVTLTLSDRMSGEFNTLSVTVADREPITLETVTEGNVVTAAIPAIEASGATPQRLVAWKITYRVVSADGHPVTGEVDFEAPVPAPADPKGSESPDVSHDATSDSAANEQPENPSAREGQNDAGPSRSFLVISGIVAIPVAVFIVFGVRRRARDRSADA